MILSRLRPLGLTKQQACSSSGRSPSAPLEPLLAALLFTAHPIHTEAVAGIVGHAELLSAALALLAVMSYMSAASSLSHAQHYRLLTVAVCTLWLAALAKEIGITMVSCHSQCCGSAARACMVVACNAPMPQCCNCIVCLNRLPYIVWTHLHNVTNVHALTEIQDQPCNLAFGQGCM